jgi:molecular chaperone DnaJ
MSDKRDYYEVLGVGRDASTEAIKKAYKRLAKQFHPDRNRGERRAEEKFKELSEAYQALSDPEKRRQYDLFGHAAGRSGRTNARWHPGGGPAEGFRWTAGSRPGGQDAGESSGAGSSFEEIFNQIFGRGGRGASRSRGFPPTDPFESGFAREATHPGQDAEAEITIGFEQAVRGGIQRFSIERHGPCASCAGSGRNRAGASHVCGACHGTGAKLAANAGTRLRVPCADCQAEGRIYTEPCQACRGNGSSSRVESLAVNIPPGVDDGGRLRIPGKGGAGPEGSGGDLYLRVRGKPHPFFRRERRDLHLDLPVTVTEAALGGTVAVPTLDGKAVLKVPAGTQSGNVLRMKGKGVPGSRGEPAGDMLVHIGIAVPRNPDARLRGVLEQLRPYEPDPRAGRF